MQAKIKKENEPDRRWLGEPKPSAGKADQI